MSKHRKSRIERQAIENEKRAAQQRHTAAWNRFHGRKDQYDRTVVTTRHEQGCGSLYQRHCTCMT